ncbi:hypothetical protein IAR55_003977 [Kwoniella newhampshirensis]|uniref:Endoplasmic reticulum protein n=1 Tax=Kwoniella newhampshirensis TaxID=1651941 RepID=A0AAW0YY80_9TREE
MISPSLALNDPLPNLGSPDVLTLLLYIIFGLIYHSINRKSYRRHWAISYHAAAGVGELGLYYLGFEMSMGGLSLCLIQSGTNLILSKRLMKGVPSLTRPAYQAGAILRPVMSLYAYNTRCPRDYHDSIAPLHAFVYARLLLLVYSSISPSPSFEDNINSKQVYNLAICASALVAVGQTTRGVSAVTIYLMLVLVVGKLSLWTRTVFACPDERSAFCASLAHILDYIGFRTPSFGRPDSSNTISNNGPPIGRLPADVFGHWLNALGRGDEDYPDTTDATEKVSKRTIPPETPELVEKEEGIGMLESSEAPIES